jgi:hypothetical protein
MSDPIVGLLPDHREARLLQLYDRAGDAVGHFWEWRHKVIVLASTTLALVFAITSWMYEQSLGGGAMYFPLIVGGAMFCVFAMFDRRNGMIIKACYESAAAIEQILRTGQTATKPPRGVFEAITGSRQPLERYEPDKWTYGWVLLRVYVGAAIILFVLAFASLWIGTFEPEWLQP